MGSLGAVSTAVGAAVGIAGCILTVTAKIRDWTLRARLIARLREYSELVDKLPPGHGRTSLDAVIQVIAQELADLDGPPGAIRRRLQREWCVLILLAGTGMGIASNFAQRTGADIFTWLTYLGWGLIPLTVVGTVFNNRSLDRINARLERRLAHGESVEALLQRIEDTAPAVARRLRRRTSDRALQEAWTTSTQPDRRQIPAPMTSSGWQRRGPTVM